MKNFKLVLFFASSLLLLLLAFPVMAQSGVDVTTAPTIFQKILLWGQNQVTGMVAGIVFAFMAKKGWTLIIKKAANKGALITKELGELLTDSSVLLSVVDKSIKDDGTVVENSLPEMIAAGKGVVTEFKDVTMTITPK